MLAHFLEGGGQAVLTDEAQQAAQEVAARSGFGFQVEELDGAVIVFLRGWDMWMLWLFLGLLIVFGFVVGFGLGRRVGRVEGRAVAKKALTPT